MCFLSLMPRAVCLAEHQNMCTFIVRQAGTVTNTNIKVSLFTHLVIQVLRCHLCLLTLPSHMPSERKIIFISIRHKQKTFISCFMHTIYFVSKSCFIRPIVMIGHHEDDIIVSHILNDVLILRWGGGKNGAGKKCSHISLSYCLVYV